MPLCQCPEINSVEPEDEQNERIRRSATDLNKRDDLNTGSLCVFRGSAIVKRPLQGYFALILAVMYAKKNMLVIFFSLLS